MKIKYIFLIISYNITVGYTIRHRIIKYFSKAVISAKIISL